MIPPVVSYPGHFAAILCRIPLAAYPAIGGFEIRLLYVYGNAQVGFSPFGTELDITSAHTHSCECRNLLTLPEGIPELRYASSGMTEKFK